MRTDRYSFEHNNIFILAKTFKETQHFQSPIPLPLSLSGKARRCANDYNGSPLGVERWEQGWDILFFAGHSGTSQEGQRGEIQLNQTERLTIDDLRFALKKAIGRRPRYANARGRVAVSFIRSYASQRTCAA
ncbi:MAG: hypothetical protein F6K56_39115 [Moorea sp. SIO3G5]|nr:hypothetical protein [Moorena sp. SIO3G5]